MCPEHAYAHTLLGHEHWLVKDYERALSSFQHASALQPRHYNAWLVTLINRELGLIVRWEEETLFMVWLGGGFSYMIKGVRLSGFNLI